MVQGKGQAELQVWTPRRCSYQSTTFATAPSRTATGYASVSTSTYTSMARAMSLNSGMCIVAE